MAAPTDLSHDVALQGKSGPWKRQESSKSEAASVAELMVMKQAPLPVFKKPRNLVLFVGNLLAICAGYINAGSILAFGFPTSHVSGPTTRFAMSLEDLANGKGGDFARINGLTLVFFTLGCILCGLVMPKGGGHNWSHRGTALIIESGLLFAAAFVPHDPVTPFLAAMACGLQNALSTMHLGTILRTTHVTGTLTDIGTNLGRLIVLTFKRCFTKGKLANSDQNELKVVLDKLSVLVPVYCNFFIGSIIGSAVCRHLDFENHEQGFASANVLIVPAIITGFIGFVYSISRPWLKKYLKAAKKDTVESGVQQLQEALENTKHVLKELQTTDDEQNEEDKMEEMLQAVHEVQNAVTELQEKRHSERVISTV